MAERDAGFTLLEAALALAILAGGLVMVQRLQATGFRLERAAAQKEAALLRAEAAMAEALATGPRAREEAGLSVTVAEFVPGSGLVRLRVRAVPEGGGGPVILETLVAGRP